MAESCSNNGGDYDDAGGGEGKIKVDCEGEANDDGDDNDGGIDINDGNDANGGDSMSKADCDDDAYGGGGIAMMITVLMGMVFLRIGVLTGMLVMKLMMVMIKLRVLQSSKMEMTVRVMQ